jgi:hypothetical protein
MNSIEVSHGTTKRFPSGERLDLIIRHWGDTQPQLHPAFLIGDAGGQSDYDLPITMSPYVLLTIAFNSACSAAGTPQTCRVFVESHP